MRLLKLTCAAVLAAAASAAAQPNISPAHRNAWQENCGWTSWRQSDDSGAHIYATCLSGTIWCENTGWLLLGDGSPGPGGSYYPNLTGANYGVNVLPNGDLAGFAWGENTGWVNFDTSQALGQARARFDTSTWRLRGFAWGENTGWLNLDQVNYYVGQYCWVDCDENNSLNANDFICFLNRFAAAETYANCDRSTSAPVLNVNDFVCFMSSYAHGCP